MKLLLEQVPESALHIIVIFRCALRFILNKRQLRHRLKRRPRRLVTAFGKLADHGLEVGYLVLNHLHTGVKIIRLAAQFLHYFRKAINTLIQTIAVPYSSRTVETTLAPP